MQKLQPSKMAVLRLSVDLGIFEMLQATREPLSSTQIAEASGAEPRLVGIVEYTLRICVHN